MLHCTNRCGRTGVRWFAAHHRLTTLRDWISDVDTHCRLTDADTAGLIRCDNTAGLDPETVAVKPSAPPRRPRRQNDAARHEAVRARGRGGEVVRRARPVDNAARLRGGPLSLRLRRGGRDSRTLLHCTKRCGRAGPAVRWFAAHDRLTALRDFGGAPSSLRLRCGGRDSRTNLHCTR